MNSGPVEPVIYRLRCPIRQGGAEYSELTLRAPDTGNLLTADGHAPESAAYAPALLSSLSGVPLMFLKKIVPEDYSDLRIIPALTSGRRMGSINLLDKEEEEDRTGDPAEAAEDTPPPNSAKTSAA